MHISNRRKFLGDVSRGMIISSVGAALAGDLGFSSAFAEQADSDALTFGELEPLVDLMQDTQAEKLQPLLVDKLRRGEADLQNLTAAGALANARTFGGEDYVGFHCMMALAPALEMSAELPQAEQPLPVLKVLRRNTARMESFQWKKPEVLKPVKPAELSSTDNAGHLIREATRQNNPVRGEQILGTLAKRSAQEAYNALQYVVHDHTNVHCVALAHRAWEMIDLLGAEHAHTLLRQSIRFSCTRRNTTDGHLGKLLPRLLDENGLEGKTLGGRKVNDEWVRKLAQTIYRMPREQAAEAVAMELADGAPPEAVGEALSLAANQIVLRQLESRTHGDSKGVHASDAVNAWRNIARVTNDRHKIVSLIVAAYHVGSAGKDVVTGQSSRSGQTKDDDVFVLFRDKAQQTTPANLLREAEEAIRANEQIAAGAAILNYSELGEDARPVFDLLLKYAVSEDGRLHAEKYYRTVTEEFAATRPAFRWRQLVALARVTASAYGMHSRDKRGGRAPGYEQARELLGLT